MINYIASRAPLYYLKLYISTIMLFAVLFTIFAKDFHHSTVKYESNFSQQSAELAMHFQSELRDAMAEINQFESCSKIRTFIPESVKVLWWGAGDIERMSSTNNYMTLFSFQLYYTLIENNVKIDTSTKITLTGIAGQSEHDFVGALMFPVDDIDRTNCFTGKPITGSSIPSGYEWDFDFPRYAFLINIGKQTEPINLEIKKKVVGSVLMLEKNSRKMVRGFYRLYVDGNPSGMDNIFEIFLRMLYLSAVTITTLGYGDIVPTSSITRLLVALESFGGVVIAGLFLTSLSSRINRNN